MASDTEKVRVEVAVAHVRERAVAVQALVAGPEVDRRVAARPRAVVEVPMVDVDPDAAELVDELQEPVEVDGDEVVDRQPGQRAHRVDAALRAALAERRVDPVHVIRDAWTLDRRQQVARE